MLVLEDGRVVQEGTVQSLSSEEGTFQPFVRVRGRRVVSVVRVGVVDSGINANHRQITRRGRWGRHPR